MALNISDLAGGGYFSIEARVSSGVPTSVGTLISLSEVEGKVYKISNLSNNGSASQTTSNITFIADGVALLDNVTLFGSGGQNTVTKNDSSGAILDTVTCKSFSVIGNAGTTGRTVLWTYEIGSFK